MQCLLLNREQRNGALLPLPLTSQLLYAICELRALKDERSKLPPALISVTWDLPKREGICHVWVSMTMTFNVGMRKWKRVKEESDSFNHVWFCFKSLAAPTALRIKDQKFLARHSRLMETGSKLFLASANFLSHLICQPPGIHTDSKRQVSTAIWPSVFSPPFLLGSCRPPSRSLSMASSNAVPSLEPCWNPLPGWGQSLPPLFPGPCVPDSPER